ncbi:hypothetical protein QJQ45_013517 [Haematococcus lacustris]|nr:hypothetical protein QJQ45_013517 [Haematococcus lacustris]
MDSFAAAKTRSKRVLVMDEHGKAIYHERDALDCSYLPLLDENAADQKDGAGEADLPHPLCQHQHQHQHQQAVAAEGEMDVIIDLINNLEAARHLDYKILATRPRSGMSALKEATQERLLQAGQRASQLQDCSQRLLQGAAALRLVAARDNLYYTQVTLQPPQPPPRLVTELQRYWRLRRNPAEAAEHADAPFSADVAFHEALLPGQLPPHLHHMLALQARCSTASRSTTGPLPGHPPAAAPPSAAPKGGLGDPPQGPGGAAAAQVQDPLGWPLGSQVPPELASGPSTRLALLRDSVTGHVRLQLEEPGSIRSTYLPEPAATGAEATGAGGKGGRGEVMEEGEGRGGEGGPQQQQGGGQGGAGGGPAPGVLQGRGRQGEGGKGYQVALGVKAVHQLLLSCQQRLLWQLVGSALDRDARGAASAGSNLSLSLAKKVVSTLAEAGLPHSPSSALHPPYPPNPASPPNMGWGGAECDNSSSRGGDHGASFPAASTSSPDLTLLGLRPLLLEFALQCRLPPGSIGMAPRPPQPSLYLHPVLQDLGACLSHTFFKQQLRRMLDLQAHRLPGLSLHWLTTSRLCTGALVCRIAPHTSHLILLQVTLA